MTTTLQEIRQQLRKKFPQAHGMPGIREDQPDRSTKPFEISTFPMGAISEIIPSEKNGGLSLWIAGILGNPKEMAALPEFVLVDAGDHFDPASYATTACSRLLWVRCQNVHQALKAADMLVRDGNIPLVILDIFSLPMAALKSISLSIWWRLKLCCEQTACRLVILAPFPLVPCAGLRLSLSSNLKLEDFSLMRDEILQRVSIGNERLATSIK